MRRPFTLIIVAGLVAIAALAGCGQQSATDLGSTTSDSLLASSPIEPPAGDITPQTDLGEPVPEPATTPAPAPKPQTTTPRPRASTPPAQPRETGVAVDAGTALEISVATQISTETANVGDTWTGDIKESVIVGDRVVFPAGSVVTGQVVTVKPAEKGDRALLGLAVTSITVNGKEHAVSASTEPIEAGSTRARNLGAIGAGAAAGAIAGKAIGGSGKGALIGGLLGGAAAGAGVAASKGYQVVIKEGTVITFNVSEKVTVRS